MDEEIEQPAVVTTSSTPKAVLEWNGRSQQGSKAPVSHDGNQMNQSGNKTRRGIGHRKPVPKHYPFHHCPNKACALKAPMFHSSCPEGDGHREPGEDQRRRPGSVFSKAERICDPAASLSTSQKTVKRDAPAIITQNRGKTPTVARIAPAGHKNSGGKR